MFALYRGCFLTSSLMGTLSLSLTIPLTMIVDIWVKNVHYTLKLYAGALPMMVSFIAVTLLTHFENWDPLLDGLIFMHRKCCKQTHLYRYVDLPAFTLLCFISKNAIVMCVQ